MKKTDRKALVWSICAIPLLISLGMCGLVIYLLFDFYLYGYEGLVDIDSWPRIIGIFFGGAFFSILIIFWARRISEDGIYVFRERPKNINDTPRPG